MNDKKIIQKYINNFRRRISPYLKPGIGLSCEIHPAELGGGAILEFTIGPELKNEDEYEDLSASANAALSYIPQKAFGGNLNGFKFIGTNLIMEGDRIILIKDDSPSQWDDRAAEKDVQKILHPPTPREK